MDTGTNLEREIIAAFPIDVLFFIITSGLFVVVSFPYNTVSIASFHPFVNITYFYANNFPIGTIEIYCSATYRSCALPPLRAI